MKEDIKIRLNPYLGKSKNFIELFSIIGYEKKIISNYISQQSEDVLILSKISEIKSDNCKNKIGAEVFIEKIYPNKPSILKIKKTKKMPNPSNVISFSCFDNIDGKSKTTFSCYAFRFYEYYIDDISKLEYYIPKAFFILSEYPLFTTFYEICSFLLENKDKKDGLPIEILIYSIVNNIPSPINNKLIFKNFNPNIVIPKLSGYPYIEFHMYKMINLLPINVLIKIFMLFYLETDLLIFSPNLEQLNLFMFTLHALNYPWTDSNYFWHVYSIPSKDIKKGQKSINSSFLGVNDSFNKSYNFEEFHYLNFIINLENKKDCIVNIRYNNEVEEIKYLLNYIDKILNNKNVESYFLSNSIISLKKNLENLKKYEHTFTDNKSDSFFHINDNINQNNKKIQNIFYEFNLEIISILYKDMQFNISSSFITKENNINLPFSNEEKVFLKLIKRTIKYMTYFDHFIKYFNMPEEMNIALYFFDEFSNTIMKDINNKRKFNKKYCELIDDFYKLTDEKTTIIDFNVLNQEYQLIKEKDKNTYEKFIQKKSQLFSFDIDILNYFLQYKNIYFKTLIKIEENKIITIDKIIICEFIKNYLEKNLSEDYYIPSSLIYLFCIAFSLVSFLNSVYFFSELLKYIENMKYFQRYYLCILIKSIKKSFSLNSDIHKFSDIELYNLNNYCQPLLNLINKNIIIPNQEISIFLKKISELNKEKTNKKNKVDEFKLSIEKDLIDNFNILKDEDILIFKFKEKTIKNKLLSYYDIFKKMKEIYDYIEAIDKKIDYEIEDLIEIIINIIYIESEKKQNNIIKCLLELLTIFLDKYPLDLTKHNEKVVINKYI